MFYIRADGNAQTGAGHIMRCLTIAEELKKKEPVTFLCADEASAALAERYGYGSFVLGKEPFSEDEVSCIAELLKQDAGKWLGEVHEPDAQEEKANAEGGQTTPRILIDSYLATPDYVEKVAALGKTAFLDDMCREVFLADVIINYNAFAREEAYEAMYGQRVSQQYCSRQAGVLTEPGTGEEKSPTFLLGSDFIPIREQFANKRAVLRDKVEAILITTGGGDKDNLAGAILEVLLKNDVTKHLTMHVVSGAFNPHMEILAGLADTHENIQVHKNVTDMAELMCGCDMAVTAGGTTVYELCTLGVPFVCFSYAENQDALVSYIGEQRIALSAGSMDSEEKECRGQVLARISQLAGRLAVDAEDRKECHKREVRMVDGRGAARIAEALLTM